MRDTADDSKARSTEYYDARERRTKAKWHGDRVGKQRGASFKKQISNDYEAELLERGVKDSDGNQKPLTPKTQKYPQRPFVHDDEDPKSAGTKVLHGFAFRG